MAAHQILSDPPSSAYLNLRKIAGFPQMRALAWDQDVLYASRGYTLLRAKITSPEIKWETIAEYSSAWWRNITSSSRLTSRLFRDGFHALAISSAHIVAAVPHGIMTLHPGENKFRITHKVLRGTRPLHICVAPNGHLFWGEYFDNSQRDEVHIYASTDHGHTWEIAYTFPKGAIRHVHNIVFDKWQNWLWLLTGDNGDECRIVRASCDFRDVEVVLSANQQARAVALIPTEGGLYFSSDTPSETNHVYHVDRRGNVTKLASLPSSSTSGCSAGGALFFSTMIEPSSANPSRDVCVFGSADGTSWDCALKWKKDHWPMRFFQYGNAFLPDGENTTEFLAVSTVAVENADGELSIWR